MQWHIVDTGCRTAVENMALDEALLEDLKDLEGPVLHFYEWEGMCATHGYFLNPADHLQLEGAKKFSLQLAKRPTGGGIIFHSWDFAFSLLMPANCSLFSTNPLDNYHFVNQKVLHALTLFRQELAGDFFQPLTPTSPRQAADHFCMAKPTKYDVMIGSKKAVGAAQRKTQHGYLHQGSIALTLPNAAILNEILKPEANIVPQMMERTFPLLNSEIGEEALQQARLKLKELLKEVFHQTPLS